MPTLNSYFVLYTDGTSPRHAVHPDFELTQLPSVPLPDASEAFFGPLASAARDQIRQAKAAFLLSGRREVRGAVGEFFSQANTELAHCVEGLSGLAVDLLKLWAMPFSDAEALPSDPLAEDLFAVSFEEEEREVFSARTFGLAKLSQAEVVFRFTGSELTDEAALMCAHLADYAMTQSRRVEPGQAMTFGYDVLTFQRLETQPAPGFVRQVLGSQAPSLPVLELHWKPQGAGKPSEDMTEALRRSLEQRLVLEEHEVPGDSPHQSAELRHCACAGGGNGLIGWREEPAAAKESGWTFTCRRQHSEQELKIMRLGEAVLWLPQIFRYLALPAGSSVEWHADRVLVDAGGSRHEEEDSEPDAWDDR